MVARVYWLVANSLDVKVSYETPWDDGLVAICMGMSAVKYCLLSHLEVVDEGVALQLM